MDSPGGNNMSPPSIDHTNGGLNLSDAMDEAARKHAEEKGQQHSIPGGRKKRRRKSRRKSRKKKRKSRKGKKKRKTRRKKRSRRRRR